MQAVDAAGNAGPWSAPVGVRTAAVADTTPPSVPGSPRAVPTQSYQVSLTWPGSTDAGGSGMQGYRVYRSDQGSTVWAALPAGTTAFKDTRVQARTRYTYSVVAVDRAGQVSARSATAGATSAAASETRPPTVPAQLRVASCTPTALTLAWTASRDGTGVKAYHVYRNGSYLRDALTPRFTDAGLVAGTAYRYQVVAYDASATTSSPAGLSGRTANRAASAG